MMLPLTIVNTIQSVYKTSHPFPALLWFPTVYGLSASHCFVRQWNGSKRLWLAVCGRLARVDCLRTRVFRSLKHVRNDLSVWVVHPRTRHAMMSLHKCSLASTHTHTHKSLNPLSLSIRGRTHADKAELTESVKELHQTLFTVPR